MRNREQLDLLFAPYFRDDVMLDWQTDGQTRDCCCTLHAVKAARVKDGEMCLWVAESAVMTERGGEYCETEVFRAACAQDEVLLLTRARYGRMRLGRSVTHTAQ